MAFAALVTTAAHAGDEELLPPDRAFRLEATAYARGVEVTWGIASGYYLYKERFKFESLDRDLRLGTPVFPPAKSKRDPFFGRTEIYTNRVTVRVPLEGAATGKAHLRVHFQGCNEPVGVCYPPTAKDLIVDVPRDSGPSGNDSSTPPQVMAQDLLQSRGAITANQPADPLRAFRVDVLPQPDGALAVRFDIDECCYLYREKMRFALTSPDGAPLKTGLRLGRARLPPGQMVQDEYFGRTAIYRRRAQIVLPLQGKPSGAEFALNVTYQGCAERGVAICYEPITRRFPIRGQNGHLVVGGDVVIKGRTNLP